MKGSLRTLASLILLGALSLGSSALADDKRIEETTTTTTTSSGTISQIGPDAIVIRNPMEPGTLRYSSTKTTTYVDENGNPVAIETVRSGVPVTVYYDKDGSRMTATKVVVKKKVVKDD
jgi:hypothetical protein